MGFSPREVGRMSMWEFACAYAGYREAHRTGDESLPPMADDDLAKLGIVGF